MRTATRDIRAVSTSVAYGDLLDKHTERVIEKAVKGMLPKNSLGRSQLRKLKVYAGPHHPHQAQLPTRSRSRRSTSRRLPPARAAADRYGLRRRAGDAPLWRAP